jgi:hypothetical protein
MARAGTLWLVVWAVGCAPSLASVKVTAALGTQLSAFEGVFDLSATYCHYTDFAGTAPEAAPDPLCVALDRDLENWHAVNRALVGYATALAAMADDAKDRDERDSIATALGATAQLGRPFSDAIDANIISGVSRGVATLISGIVGVYRRERLGATIRDSDEALQAIARGLGENIALLDRAEQNLITTLTDTMTSVRIGSSPAADRTGIAIALSSVAAELAVHRASLAGYKRAVDSFAKAHGDLRKKLNGLGDRKADLELLKIIAADVATITRSAKTAITRPPPP